MALDVFVNFAQGTLSTGYAAGVTSFVLTTGHGVRMPAGAANYVIWDTFYADPSDDPDVEVVRGTISSDTLGSITRGQEGTADVDHDTGGRTYGIKATLTAKTLVTDLAATFSPLLTGTANQVILTGSVLSTPQSIHTGASPAFTGLTISGLTADRVPITGTGGLFGTDNNLRWDPTGGYLGIGLSTAPNKRLLVKHDWTVTTLGAVDHEVIRATTTSVGAGTVTEPHIAVSAWANDGSPTNKTITGAVNNGSGLIRITATAHGYATSDTIGIYGVTGTTEANSAWVITVIDANTFDLVGSTFTNTYVSGGTATNRSQLVGVRSIVQPNLARLQPGVGTALNDDVNCYTGQNSGTQKATDGFYLAGTAGIGGSAWYTAFSTSANSDYFFRATGTSAFAGLDFASATMTGPAIALGVGHNISLDTATGTKIGTATTQKLGFFNSTPIVQPANTTDIRTALINLGLYATGGASPLDLNGGWFFAKAATFNAGTITTTAPMQITQTWNNGAVAFNALEIGVTNTASLSTSALISAAVGGVTKWSIDAVGNVNSYTEVGGSLVHNNFGTSGATLVTTRRARGTALAMQRIQSGDAVGSMTFVGAYNNTSDSDTAGTVFTSNVAATRVMATETYTSTAQGAKFEIRTVPIGSTTIATRVTFDEAGLTLPDAHNIVVNATTGTKIGTATTQKLGFFNSTPVVQPANTTDIRTALINLGLYATGGASPLDLNAGTLTAKVVTVAGSTTVAPLTVTPGTLMTTPAPGVLETDANCLYGTTDAGNRGVIPIVHFIRCDGTRTLPNDTNENAIFNSPTNGRLTLETGCYIFEALMQITSMHATSGNALIDWLGAGTATCAAWMWQYQALDNTAPTTAAATSGAVRVTQDSAASIATAGTGTGLNVDASGTFEVTVAGTFIPSIDQVTAAAGVVGIGSYFMCYRIGSTSVVSVGQWD